MKELEKIEEAKRMLYGLPSILRSQIDLFDLDTNDWNEAQTCDMVNRHDLLFDALYHVTVSIENALEKLNEADIAKEGVVNG